MLWWMNFKQVEAFRAVMTTRSMTTAAGLLHTSQPNVSRWIALLEQQLGFALFERSGTRLVPTPEGQAFHADVERAFLGLEWLNHSAESIRQRGTGLLRIGAVGSISQCVLPDAVQAFRQAHPDIPVVVNTGGSDEVAKWVATGVCDLGYVSYPIHLSSVRFERINTACGVGIVHRAHRLARRRVLHPADFDGENFISLPTGSLNREAIDRCFQGRKRILSIETPYAPTICTMVGKGLGVSIVTPIVVRALRTADVREIPFSQATEFHSYSVVSEQFPQSRLARDMEACVQATFEALND